MSTSMLCGCPDVVIADGGTSSNTVLSSLIYEDAESFTLFFAGTDTNSRTFKIQISNDSGTTWFDWSDSTANIIPPSTVNTASVYPNPVFSAFKVLASGAVGGACTWKMQKRFTGLVY